MAYGRKKDDIIDDVTWPWKVNVVTRDPYNFCVHYLEHGLRCRVDSVTMEHLQEIKKEQQI